MTYFAGITDFDTLKGEFRKLTLENHPDKGGNPSIMRTIIEQYNEILENGFKIRYEEITEDDVHEYFNDVADVMEYEEMDFVDMEMV